MQRRHYGPHLTLLWSSHVVVVVIDSPKILPVDINFSRKVFFDGKQPAFCDTVVGKSWPIMPNLVFWETEVAFLVSCFCYRVVQTNSAPVLWADKQQEHCIWIFNYRSNLWKWEGRWRESHLRLLSQSYKMKMKQSWLRLDLSSNQAFSFLAIHSLW